MITNANRILSALVTTKSPIFCQASHTLKDVLPVIQTSSIKAILFHIPHRLFSSIWTSLTNVDAFAQLKFNGSHQGNHLSSIK